MVLGLVSLGCHSQDLGNLRFQLGQGAVGAVGGVGGHHGAVQGDHAQMHQPAAAHSFQGLDQEPSQGLLMADPEPGDRSHGRGVGCRPARGRRGPRCSAAGSAGRTAPRSRRRTAARPAGSWGRRRDGRARRLDRRTGTAPGRVGRPRRARTRRGGLGAASRAGREAAGRAGRGRREGSGRPWPILSLRVIRTKRGLFLKCQIGGRPWWAVGCCTGCRRTPRWPSITMVWSSSARTRLQCHSSHSSTIAAMVTLILGGLPIREPVAAYGPS
jgi:hypothetical protein